MAEAGHPCMTPEGNRIMVIGMPLWKCDCSGIFIYAFEKLYETSRQFTMTEHHPDPIMEHGRECRSETVAQNNRAILNMFGNVRIGPTMFSGIYSRAGINID